MPRQLSPKKNYFAPSFKQLTKLLSGILPNIPHLNSRGNRPLQMTFEDQLNALIFFHLEEHTSARHLVQILQEDDFARNNIAPEGGISRSSFSEAINERGLEQFLAVFQQLQKQACSLLPKKYSQLGELVSIDGSLIDSVLSMAWADYRKNSKKARLHLGFNINQGIPQKLFLTDGKADERPFVHNILEPGQTGIMDRGYQHHQNFDQLQEEIKHFVCRIKGNTHKTCLKKYDIDPDSIVFYDAKVLLGKEGQKQTKNPLRLVGYTVEGTKYWVATDRFDLSADDIALIYKLRWEIEKFFGWWKRHLRVYHLIARSKHGLMVQILSGLITYLLLAIYCHEQHGEPVSIKRVRELRIKIQNETRELDNVPPDPGDLNSQNFKNLHASP
ncbi:MAG: IS4 family transposase [Desulfobulbaceae bacterium]|nr:IS4 family transposase [Desulfobulbaceae bacterium]